MAFEEFEGIKEGVQDIVDFLISQKTESGELGAENENAGTAAAGRRTRHIRDTGASVDSTTFANLVEPLLAYGSEQDLTSMVNARIDQQVPDEGMARILKRRFQTLLRFGRGR